MNLSKLNLIIRRFGIGWVVYRGWKSVSDKLGYWKFKLPSQSWDYFGCGQFASAANYDNAEEFFEQRKSQGIKFFFDPVTLGGSRDWLRSLDPSEQWAEETADRVGRGEFHYFSSRWIDIGEQPNWFLNPYDNLSAPSDKHFSEINEFGFGDVKTIWEASRFGFVFDLARSFARTGDEQCAETYWRLLENWMELNPPYQGINWKCGQESGLRFLAAVFGLYVFSKCPATSVERIKKLSQLAAATGNRIEKHIGYAISQKNNHGISEAVALWTIGTLFPEFKQSKNWRSKGLSVLKQLCLELIYEDGAFSQHSTNYHRLVLHLLCWTARLAEVNDVQLDARVLEKFEQASDFIESLLDDFSGSVPRYGNDDGARILPFNHCDYFDFRPANQLCRAVAKKPVQFSDGCWNEDLFWFGLSIPETLDDAKSVTGSATEQTTALKIFPQGGIHRLSSDQTIALIRAGSFRHRPAQSDLMHVDISWKGYNVAIDPGTYSYNGQQHWKNIPFMQGQHHNSVIIDSMEPQTRVSKFMLLPWNEAELVSKHQSEHAVGIEWKRTASHQLSDSVVHHRALIVLPQNVTLVLDALWSQQPHDYTINWLLGGKLKSFEEPVGKLSIAIRDQPYCVQVTGSQETSSNFVTGENGSARGWFSPKYLELEPATSLITKASGKNLAFQTSFGPAGHWMTDQAMLALPESNNPYCLLDSDCVQEILKANIR